MKLRCSVRAVILDEEDRVLLCRFVFPEEAGEVVVWAAPGGGVEDGETPLAALRRELHVEVGLAVGADPPHVWHQEVIGPGYAAGHDGVINDYFVVRTASFQPWGSMSDDELAGEHMVGFRWWRLEDIAVTAVPRCSLRATSPHRWAGSSPAVSGTHRCSSASKTGTARPLKQARLAL